MRGGADMLRARAQSAQPSTAEKTVQNHDGPDEGSVSANKIRISRSLGTRARTGHCRGVFPSVE